MKVETFNFENLSKKVLGQHGIELLMERECSFFFPSGVVGLLCIGTKVSLFYFGGILFIYLIIITQGFNLSNLKMITVIFCI